MPQAPSSTTTSLCVQVDAALFEPPPFQPSKLSVQYLPGAALSSASLPSSSNSASSVLPRLRRYTLTHNDITGALQLSIGSDYNQRQVQGFYTRILRDEITAEWLFGRGGPAPAELHIYCHVSGEERWLAPPQLRNFIFRREMTLVSAGLLLLLGAVACIAVTAVVTQPDCEHQLAHAHAGSRSLLVCQGSFGAAYGPSGAGMQCLHATHCDMCQPHTERNMQSLQGTVTTVY